MRPNSMCQCMHHDNPFDSPSQLYHENASKLIFCFSIKLMQVKVKLSHIPIKELKNSVFAYCGYPPLVGEEPAPSLATGDASSGPTGIKTPKPKDLAGE